MGFGLVATDGTAEFLTRSGLSVETINKVAQGSPHAVDRLKEKKIAMVINTPLGRTSTIDSYSIRRTSIEYNVPYFTTSAAANAATSALESLKSKGLIVKSLQEYLRSMEPKAGKRRATGG